jgi:hypothetical protein
MRQLPQVVSGTKDLLKNERLKVITASFDSDEAALHGVIREQGIRYPVIWHNKNFNRGNVDEWNIRGIPTTVLISPQGDIVADLHAGEDFQQVLEYFIDNGEQAGVVSLDGSAVKNSDGTVEVSLNLYSSQHRPVDVKVEVYRNVTDENGERQYESLSEEGRDYSFTQSFMMFADEQYSFTISDYGEAEGLIVMATAVYPGTEHLNEGEGVGPSFYRQIPLK